MPTEYFIDDSLTRYVETFLKDTTYTEFADIREQGYRFVAAYVIKSTKEGEAKPTTGDVVQLKRISPLDKVFIQAEYRLLFDHTRWAGAADVAQAATLHKALMGIEVVRDEDKIKVRTRKPDVVEYNETITRFGFYRDSLLRLRDSIKRAADAKKLTADTKKS